MFDLLAKYAEEMSAGEPDCMLRVRARSAASLQHHDMISGPVIGRLLAMLARASDARRVLELGTFTGYATLWLASALSEAGEVLTVDSNLKYLAIARPAFEQSPWADRITSVHADAFTFVSTMSFSPDFVFLDADKRRYPDYWRLLRPLLKTGSFLVADNVFWKGEVRNPVTAKGKALATFSQMVLSDPDFQSVLLPVRDGLLVARRC